jgi:hypothetical protein
LSEILIVLAYEAGMILFLAGLTQRIGRRHDLDRDFDGFYFLKWSAGLAALTQVGFVLLVSVLFHDKHSLAVSLTALVGIPGWLLIGGWLQWSFFQRYKRLSNLIRRLERMTDAERAIQLENLPPEIFSQLPGDYRFVSRSDGPQS